jgi:hypothetical protein
MKLTFLYAEVSLTIERGLGPSHGKEMRDPRLAVQWRSRDGQEMRLGEEESHKRNAMQVDLLDAAEAETLATAVQAMAARLKASHD